jgi:uncharacterized RDD family membrane protein YckC
MNQALTTEHAGQAQPGWKPAAKHQPLKGIGFWHRSVSYAIDIVLYYMAANRLVWCARYAVDAAGLAKQVSPFLPEALAVLLEVGMFVTYFVVFEWQFGATPGKALLQLRVVDRFGEPCSFGAAFVRGLIRPVDALVFGSIAAYNMHAPLNQRLGDKLADTLVVSSHDAGICAPKPWWRFVFAAVLASLACMAFGFVFLLGL